MKSRIAAVSVALISAMAVQSFAQKPTKRSKLIEFDPPGTTTAVSPLCDPYCGAFAYANNDLGYIVGFYSDTNVVPHGYLRTPDGHFISFDAPGAGLGAGLNQGTVANGINDLGVIVGYIEDSNYAYHSYIRYPNGRFTTFDAPGAGTDEYQGTVAWSINLWGATAGGYFDSNYTQHGFVRSPNGNIATFDPDGSIATTVCEETCLNDAGFATGYFADANYAYHGFLRTPNGKIITFDAPDANGYTIASSINQEGTIAGYYQDAAGVSHGFVRTPDGQFTPVDVPAAANGPGQGTAASSINLLGATTGLFSDANNTYHGFSFLAGCFLETFDAPGATTILPNQGTRPSTNNLWGEVTGSWTDDTGLNHGFVWLPSGK